MMHSQRSDSPEKQDATFIKKELPRVRRISEKPAACRASQKEEIANATGSRLNR